MERLSDSCYNATLPTAKAYYICAQRTSFANISRLENAHLAAELAADSQVRGCDPVYVALALQYSALLITLDREQQARVPSGIAARTPAQELAALA
jgi:hypothetical protein